MPDDRASWRKRIRAVVLGLIAALALTEVLARLALEPIAGGYPPGLFRPDDEIGYRLERSFAAAHVTPSFDITIRTNAAGYRGPEVGAKRTQRVLAIGDSFCFGHGVELADAYPALLADRLVERGHEVEVVNLGVPGYGTHHADALLRADGDALDPDGVVLGFYVGNDFRDNHVEHFGRLTARGGMLVTLTEEQRASWWYWLQSTVVTHSRAAQFLYRGLGAATLSEEERLAAVCAALPWDPGFGSAMCARTWDEVAEGAWSATAAALIALRDTCAKRAVDLLVVLLPAPHQYFQPMWPMVVEQCSLDADAFDLARPNAELVRFCTGNGIAVLDLLPRFSQRMQERPGEPLWIDVHFNEVGHALAADAIAARVAAWFD